MEAVAAVGLAGNIVQFMDFSWKLLHESQSLFRSSTGASDSNDVLELISRDLAHHLKGFRTTFDQGSIPETLIHLSEKCETLSQDLLKVLDTLKVRGSPRKLMSFVQALRNVWQQDQIDSLFKRLENLRSEVQFGLQITLKLVESNDFQPK